MNVKGACYQDEDSPSPLEIDGFTTFGVRFIQPEVGEWVEVSVLGRTYEPRVDSFSLPTHRKSTPLLNRLTNGSLIDIGGLIIMFQDPIAMAQQRCIHIEELIRSMNKLQPQCPVMFNEIRFHYVDPHKREQNAMLNLTSEPVNNISGHGPTHIPTTDFSELPEDQRMYVFTSCGHVFGYHSSLEQSVSCPLCRKIGPYVPLLLPFEKSICDGFPTHVFNPCGHGVSENAAIYWSRCRVYNRHIPFHRMCAICPFCATELNRSQPYSRLVVQLSSPDADWSDWCKLLEDCRGCDEFCITNYPFTEVNLERDSEEWVNLVIKAQCLYFNQRSLRSGYNQGLCGIINYCGRDDAVSAEEGERDDDDVEIYRDASRQCSVEYFDRRFIYYPTYAPQLANHPTFR